MKATIVRVEKTDFERLNPNSIEINGRIKTNWTNQKDPNFDKPLSELRKEY
jgi:hypothetical protein